MRNAELHMQSMVVPLPVHLWPFRDHLVMEIPLVFPEMVSPREA